ncbi:hypothetical protein H4O18_03710 [Arenibacter sp. BSSL-BM3]|uniref:Uncharacterized protein n=1 Tax=Arenibacter arenosicollis TaxID=2762274 RepID=A0ABR7QIT2_9FLAO|nr:hypothetical protein [Arenibacter arenosicollis]MBC8767091.1 hypothetical protein [Arenibacter arenosicollis]
MGDFKTENICQNRDWLRPSLQSSALKTTKSYASRYFKKEARMEQDYEKGIGCAFPTVFPPQTFNNPGLLRTLYSSQKPWNQIRKTGLAAPFPTKLRFENHKKLCFAILQKRSENGTGLRKRDWLLPSQPCFHLKHLTTQAFSELFTLHKNLGTKSEKRDWLRPSLQSSALKTTKSYASLYFKKEARMEQDYEKGIGCSLPNRVSTSNI